MNDPHPAANVFCDSSLIARATLVCVEAHTGQYRKGGKDPYALHPLRVAESLRCCCPDPHVIAAALLHDVREDTEHSIDDFPPRVHELVDLLTRRKGRNRVGAADETKTASLDRLAASGDGEAILIKLADRCDNLREGMASLGSDWLHSYLPTSRRIAAMAIDHGWGDNALTVTLAALIAEAEHRIRN
ncbi:MAG: HD domain-containing protein [Planctomycetota bacterium]|nr:MAG: HD domain-containing protein [Planctomycetota bacterium]